MKRNAAFKLFISLCTICFQARTGFSQEQILWCGKVETEAYFKNGPDDWTSYLNKTVNAQVPLLHCAPAKTFCIEVRFLVEKDGSLADTRPLTKVGYGMEEELIRAVKHAPNWIPATQNGKKCRAYKCADFIFEIKQTAGDFL